MNNKMIPPPGCKWFSVTREINGSLRVITVAAPDRLKAGKIADVSAAAMRDKGGK